MPVLIRNGRISLDKQIDKKRYRFATGKEATKQMIKWYERHFDEEFNKLLAKKRRNMEGSISFQEYGSMVLEITKNDRLEASHKNLLMIFERLCEVFGDRHIIDIKPTDIQMWQSRSNLAPKTIVNYRSCLNMIFEAAYNDEITNRNPLRAVKTPKQKRTKTPVYYSEADMQKILQHTEGRWKNLFQILFFTGMRAGELIALKWSDIDFDNGTITLQRNVRDGTEKESLKTQDKRVIPMFRQAREALKRQQLETGLKQYVFTTQYGKRYNRSDKIRVMFGKVCEEAGVQVGNLHDIRRSCNTMLKQRGFKPDFVLDFMGHNEEYVNRKHYTGKILDDLSKLDDIVV